MSQQPTLSRRSIRPPAYSDSAGARHLLDEVDHLRGQEAQPGQGGRGFSERATLMGKAAAVRTNGDATRGADDRGDEDPCGTATTSRRSAWSEYFADHAESSPWRAGQT